MHDIRTRLDRWLTGESSLSLVLALCLTVFLAGGLTGCAKDSAPMTDPSLDLEAARKAHAETMAAQSASGTNSSRLSELESEPETFDAKLAAGDQLRASGDPGRALWAYIEALELDPDSIEPRTRIGLLQLESDPDRAAAAFSEVLETNPDSSAAHFGLGLAYIARDQPEKAFLELVRADELNRNNPAILGARGTLEEQMGRRKSALALLKRAHALRPNDANIMNNLGVTLLLDEQLDEATRIFERATLTHPDDEVLQNNLGLAYGLAGRYRDAFDAFSKHGEPRSAHNNLGYVYFLNRKFDEAMVEYEKALLAKGGRRTRRPEKHRSRRGRSGRRHGIARGGGRGSAIAPTRLAPQLIPSVAGSTDIPRP